MARQDPNWQDRLHEEVFEATLAQLARRRELDPAFTLAELQGLLETAYIAQGNDWVGRGEVHEVTTAAEIAAYEAMLANWAEADDKGQS